MNWNRVVFLHTGWTSRYDGTEAPEGGHAYLKRSVGVEAENFKSIDGWCYGYAPVSRTSKGRAEANTSKAGRTLNISKLGASALAEETAGITIVWTRTTSGSRPCHRGPLRQCNRLPIYAGVVRRHTAIHRQGARCRLSPRSGKASLLRYHPEARRIPRHGGSLVSRIACGWSGKGDACQCCRLSTDGAALFTFRNNELGRHAAARGALGRPAGPAGGSETVGADGGAALAPQR